MNADRLATSPPPPRRPDAPSLVSPPEPVMPPKKTASPAPAPSPGLVSVIIPTYNRGRTLRRAIYSILNQGYAALEVLVVDDGSPDDTAEVMAAIPAPRVRYLPLEKNRGASRARNAGLAA